MYFSSSACGSVGGDKLFTLLRLLDLMIVLVFGSHVCCGLVAFLLDFDALPSLLCEPCHVCLLMHGCFLWWHCLTLFEIQKSGVRVMNLI